MNILILTGHFGMGHVCAANAISQEILADVPYANVHLVDAIEYMYPHTKSLIYGQFNFMVKYCSGVYNFVNRLAGKYSDVPMKGEIIKKVESLLREYQPDVIISTLPACSKYISAYKETTGSRLPLYTYITDIVAHEEWISSHTDMYFVGSDSTKNTLIANGIPHEHIAVSGIPVNRHFKQGCNVGTSSSQSEILIMGGGLGLIPCVSKMLAEMAQDKQLHVTIICGKNARLKNKLTQKYPTVEVVGFTDKVAQYMQRADLLITKAGGITTFEAIYCHTPLYVCTPFLVQEVGNAEFIEQNNIGKVVWSKKTDIASDVLALIKNTALLNMMKYNMCALQSRLCDRCVVKQLLADSYK